MFLPYESHQSPVTAISDPRKKNRIMRPRTVPTFTTRSVRDLSSTNTTPRILTNVRLLVFIIFVITLSCVHGYCCPTTTTTTTVVLTDISQSRTIIPMSFAVAVRNTRLWSTSTCKDSSDTPPPPQSSQSSRKRMYTFSQARNMVRSHGFSSKQEFLDYDCPGAYQVPKNVDELYQDEWQGWDDFLGIPLEYSQGKVLVQTELQPHFTIQSAEDYQSLFLTDDQRRRRRHVLTATQQRLPLRPDLYYQHTGWESWEEWLGLGESSRGVSE